jgi:hypothetical protein
LQLQEKKLFAAPSRQDPSRMEERSVHVGEAITINGAARNRDAKRMMDGSAVPMAGGYALTPGVDKDTWDKWRAQMADWPPLKAGQVFASERDDTTRAKAKDGQSGPSGFEPYNSSSPPDEFAGAIKTAEVK